MGVDMRTFSAAVSDVRTLTHDVREIELTLIEPAEIRFAPGQFVSFEIEREGRLPATRPYSIASSAARTTQIELLLNAVPGGPGSGYLCGLHRGDVTAFTGPVGSFALRDGARDLLLVATGTGIAPLRSMLLSLADAGSPPRAVTLFWGLRSEQDLYYQDELDDLQRRLPGFSYTTTLSRPTGAWQGPVGWVSSLVDSRIASVTNLDVFLCGNAAMIRDVRDIIRRKGICPIHTEQYYDDRATAGVKPSAA
jgi:NAD(P)H-flavin reductase